MGGSNNHRQTKNKAAPASFSLFGFLKHRRQHRRDDRGEVDDVPSPRKVWPSDYDCGHYVADPQINEKASRYIDNFHKTCVTESERHAVKLSMLSVLHTTTVEKRNDRSTNSSNSL